MGKVIDMTNKKFGRLTVLKRVQNNKKREAQWLCQCDCGNTKIVPGWYLRNGITKSCGCIKTQQLLINRISIHDKFDSLSVIKLDHYDDKGRPYYQCLCECGNKTIVSGQNLISKNVHSCGCNRFQSRGEKKIEQLLLKNNLSFQKEKKFSSCFFEDTKALARFDFYVNNSYLIEFDGEQHFTYSNKGWNTQEKFNKTKQHDKIKTQWCKKNNIPLIRIPYWKIDSLTIEDLILK